MAKFKNVMFIGVLLFAYNIFADAQRYRPDHQRIRTFARQEIDLAITPYPSADELKPQKPFEEAEPTPDEIYGPPEPSPNNTPSEIYGPPEDPIFSVDNNANEHVDQKARFIAARRLATYRTHQANGSRPAKLKVNTIKHTA